LNYEIIEVNVIRKIEYHRLLTAKISSPKELAHAFIEVFYFEVYPKDIILDQIPYKSDLQPIRRILDGILITPDKPLVPKSANILLLYEICHDILKSYSIEDFNLEAKLEIKGI
jgi:hypothetical protein